jgi:geranylgeranyl diphosphate synthase type II
MMMTSPTSLQDAESLEFEIQNKTEEKENALIPHDFSEKNAPLSENDTEKLLLEDLSDEELSDASNQEVELDLEESEVSAELESAEDSDNVSLDDLSEETPQASSTLRDEETVDEEPPSIEEASVPSEDPLDIYVLEEPSVDYETRFAGSLALINAKLAEILTPVHPSPSGKAHEAAEGLWNAMRYGTLDGGKRIRSILAIVACKACSGDLSAILPTACAIELVHAQSLMHDDLPCMDDDDMRRGRPSVHKAFGESTAVLAGDALISLAFGLISKTHIDGAVTQGRLLTVLTDFANVTSVEGLVNGQFVDIFYEGQDATPDVLQYIHTYKTGALFRFALSAGARLAGASSIVVDRFALLGETLGLAFQIVDDLLDIASTSEELGKTAGKDQLQRKVTYPALFGEEASREKAEKLIQEALHLVAIRDGLPPSYDPSVLRTLISFIFQRSR